MSRNDSDGDDRYVEIQLDGKQIIIVLAGILLLCAVSFHFGRRVGRADTGQAESQMAALVDQAPGSEAVSEEDAAAGMTFFDNVGRRTTLSTPPPVASGDDGNTGSASPPATAPAQAPAQATKQEPAPVTVPQPAAAVPAAGQGSFQVQVAAYQERARAEALAGRLRQKGYRALIAEEPDGGRTLYKVRIGGYMDRSAADAAKTRLAREEKLQAWVLQAGA